MVKTQLERRLKNRHIQLIAIGGAIGTGLFLGSGKAIHLAGPSILFAYLIIGVALFFVMRSLGELLLSNTGYASFTDFTVEYLGPWAGFVTGWTYWFCWIMTAMADITAVGKYIQFWFNVPQWVPAFLCLIVLTILNLLTVKMFGEIEFWFAIIKVVTIIALIILGLIMIVVGFKTDSGHASIQNLWSFGGFFPHGISGFFLGFQMAVFSFVGIELVGVTAAETADPEKNLPRAINSLPVRVLLFYIGALFVILCIIPWTQLNADNSPFVKVFTLVGIPAAAGIINFVVLTSAASACNSGLFSTSRMLYSLGREGNAPKSFSLLGKSSVPSTALISSTLALSVGVVLNYFLPNFVFTLVTSISAICFIWVWSVILIAHIVYLKKRPDLASASKFKAPLAPFINWLILVFFVFLLVLIGMASDTRVALFVTPVWFLLLVVAYLLHRKRKAV
ncbi:amino acid permease [Sporolactobacillus laevolacticus]|uniref:Alanine glycine permease n=1 Tax=Sporolactobacillus laevolacticus DSM 442 TaxID=1395513 RepID=V6IX85_9BACL|nr:amino acid permease [Sporolactobacillus laevolacticus]EST11895.1 alanine glycine permease [Sporolactobacillus laevolacticus DSM 442]